MCFEFVSMFSTTRWKRNYVFLFVSSKVSYEDKQFSNFFFLLTPTVTFNFCSKLSFRQMAVSGRKIVRRVTGDLYTQQL